MKRLLLFSLLAGCPSSTTEVLPDATTTDASDDIGPTVPATFFAINVAGSPADVPPLPMGTAGHSTLVWTMVQQTSGDAYDWRAIDMAVAAAPKGPDGVAEVMLTLGKTPAWALADQSSCMTSDTSHLTTCTAPPDDIAVWTRFVTALAARYDGTTMPRVRYYEIWNEADTPGFWTGTPEQLVALGQVAYPLLHGPGSVVLAPSVVGDARTPTSTAPAWLASYLAAGGAANADAGGFHGYVGAAGARMVPNYPLPENSPTDQQCTAMPSLCHGTIVEQIASIRSVLDANGLAGKPMFDTEGGWGVTGHVPQLDMQIAWITHYFILHASLAVTNRIAFASWYAWGGGSKQEWGTIEDDNKQPTAAGTAYAQVHDWLLGAAISPCASDDNGVWTCAVARAGGYHATIAWADAGASYTPVGAGHMRDVTGASTVLDGSPIALTMSPVLLEP